MGRLFRNLQRYGRRSANMHTTNIRETIKARDDRQLNVGALLQERRAGGSDAKRDDKEGGEQDGSGRNAGGTGSWRGAELARSWRALRAAAGPAARSMARMASVFLKPCCSAVLPVCAVGAHGALVMILLMLRREEYGFA